MDDKIKVLVVDDHAIIRSGLVNILAKEPDIKVVGEARDGLEALRKALETKPDVILMDIFMPRCGGLEATIAIKEKLENTRVIMLTVSEREEDLFQALKFGAHGYLLKSATIAELAEAVRRTAIAGEGPLSPAMASKLMGEFRKKVAEPELSSREMEVLKLLSQGLTDGEIANQLVISVSTVRTYVHRLLDKLHVRNRVEAAAYAARHKLEGKPSRSGS